jgi:hypothetical protein
MPFKLYTFLFFFCFVSDHSFSLDPGPKEIIRDIDQYWKFIKKTHPNPYNWTKQSLYEDEIRSLKENVGKISQNELYVQFLKVNALLKDEHTDVYFQHKEYFPIRLFWFEEGIYVYSSSFENQQINGLKLITINKIPIMDIVDSLKPLLNVMHKSAVQRNTTGMLINPDILQGLRITDSETTKFGFLNERDTLTVVLRADKPDLSMVVPLNQQGLLRNRYKREYWFVSDTSNKLLYLQYNKCAANKTESFAEFTKTVHEAIENDKPGKIIIDLRLNGGGSTLLTQPLIQELALDSLGKIKKYIMIGRSTWSAAVLNAWQMRYQLKNVILIGEETGGKLNHAGAIKYITLKHTGWIVSCSQWMFYRDANEKGGLRPDVKFTKSVDHFLNGTDAEIEYVLNDK